MTQEKDENSKKLEQIMNPIKLINYQDDSIVSKIIIERKASNITFFAFDDGQGLSEHTAPYDVLVHIIDGEAEVTLSGRPFLLKSGEMVVMPANKPHSLKALKRFKMILTMIKT